MTSISIRRLNRDTAELLGLRAAGNRHPLESEARGVPGRAARGDTAEKWAGFFTVPDRLHITAELGGPLAEDLIRRDRDRGHRAL